MVSQIRVGQFGNLFKIYKLRTMCVDAEENGAQWCEEDDPRVTKVGKFLRRFHIDELPQLWNILVGDMLALPKGSDIATLLEAV